MNTLAIALMTLTITGHQSPTSDVLVIERASVKAIRTTQVPARIAGPLKEIYVKENQVVDLNQVLAKLDDTQALIQQIVAEGELDVANAQSKENVEVQAAKAAMDLAKEELRKSGEINDRAPGAIPKNEVERQRLTVTRATAQVKVEEVNFEVAGLTTNIRQTGLELATHQVSLHQIQAPWIGLVDKIAHREGDWLQVGDPVLSLVQMDRLRVEAMIDATTAAPFELIGKKADVTIKLPNGKTKKVTGKVDYASQVGVSDKNFRVWIEFENEQVLKTEDGAVYYLFNPGMAASVEIYLNSSPNS
jgi:multidrug resistance efflux pump